MEFLLRDRHRLRVWQRHDGAATLHSAAADSDVVLLCVPATAIGELAGLLRPHLPAATLCVTIAKGLDDRGRLPIQALDAGLGPGRGVVLYGPMISEEIRAGKPAFAQCGARDPQTYARIAALFAGTALRLDAAEDMLGISWSAILKNVYAMAFGMADEMVLGDNVRGFLAVAALHELDAIVRSLGGAAVTPFHLAGLGDLITTATSRGSHHHELGRMIVRDERERLAGEGVHTLAMIRTHALFDTGRYPLFRLIDAGVRDPGTARTALCAFLSCTLD
jgi:glycerol-3-phosphate dehydrogenase (NAD(P)+)